MGTARSTSRRGADPLREAAVRAPAPALGNAAPGGRSGAAAAACDRPGGGRDLGIEHLYCCDPDVALCGLDISQFPVSGEGEEPCVVCRDLDEADADCPHCAP